MASAHRLRRRGPRPERPPRCRGLLDAAYPCCSGGLLASYDALLTLDASAADAALDSLGAQLHADVRRAGDDDIGLAFAQDSLRLDAGRRGDGDGRQTTLGVRAQRRLGDWRLGGVLSAAYYIDERNRRVNDGSGSVRARSRAAGQGYGAAFEAAWQPEAGWYPSLGLDVQHTRERNQREHGAGALNLHIDAASASLVHTELAMNCKRSDDDQHLQARFAAAAGAHERAVQGRAGLDFAW